MQDSSKVFGFYFLTLNGGGFSSDDWKNPSDSAENFFQPLETIATSLPRIRGAQLAKGSVRVN